MGGLNSTEVQVKSSGWVMQVRLWFWYFSPSESGEVILQFTIPYRPIPAVEKIITTVEFATLMQDTLTIQGGKLFLDPPTVPERWVMPISPVRDNKYITLTLLLADEETQGKVYLFILCLHMLSNSWRLKFSGWSEYMYLPSVFPHHLQYIHVGHIL